MRAADDRRRTTDGGRHPDDPSRRPETDGPPGPTGAGSPAAAPREVRG